MELYQQLTQNQARLPGRRQWCDPWTDPNGDYIFPLLRAEFLQESLQNTFFARRGDMREGRRSTDMFFESPRFSEEEAKKLNMNRRDFFLVYPPTHG